MSPGQGQHEADPPQSPNADPTPSSPPPAPVPSNDPKLGQVQSPPPPDAAISSATSQILSKITPLAALKLLCKNVEFLVEMTGDVPPTPPQPQPPRGHMRHMSDLAREKAAIVRSHSQQDLARQREAAEAAMAKLTVNPAVDGVQLRQNPAAPQTDEPKSSESAPMVIIGDGAQTGASQHDALCRRFYSRKPPPITIEAYLARIHKYCPMSTGVYLTTSMLLTRLAIEERVVTVTKRSVHRLLLGGLRVAMKALEDHCWGYVLFSQANAETLEKHYDALRNTRAVTASGPGGRPEPVPGLRLDPSRIRNQVTPAG